MSTRVAHFTYDQYVDYYEDQMDDERQGGPDEAVDLDATDYPSYAPGEIYRYPRVLRRGDTGNVVRYLQSLLDIPVDGIFGPQTETATRAFQDANNLVIDGIVGAKTWSELMDEPLYYMQVDPRWRVHPYTVTGNYGQTIGSSGCGPCSMTMVLNSLQEHILLPPGMCNLAIAHGFRTKTNGTSWGYFPKVADIYNLSCVSSSSFTTTVNALKNKQLVIASMGPGYFTKAGHFIVLWGADDYSKVIYALDPASRKRVSAPYNTVSSEAKRFFIFNTK